MVIIVHAHDVQVLQIDNDNDYLHVDEWIQNTLKSSVYFKETK